MRSIYKKTKKVWNSTTYTSQLYIKILNYFQLTFNLNSATMLKHFFIYKTTSSIINLKVFLVENFKKLSLYVPLNFH